MTTTPKIVFKKWQHKKKSNIGQCTANERHYENCSLTLYFVLKTYGIHGSSLLVLNTINGFKFQKPVTSMTLIATTKVTYNIIY